jgi:anti-anti-sigma factor
VRSGLGDEVCELAPAVWSPPCSLPPPVPVFGGSTSRARRGRAPRWPQGRSCQAQPEPSRVRAIRNAGIPPRCARPDKAGTTVTRATGPSETFSQTVREGPLVLVIARGASPAAMRRTVLEGMSGRPRDVVLDLGNLTSMTNPGLAVLVGTKARQQARHRRFTLVFGQHSATADALSRNGLRASFTTAATVAAARADA